MTRKFTIGIKLLSVLMLSIWVGSSFGADSAFADSRRYKGDSGWGASGRSEGYRSGYVHRARFHADDYGYDRGKRSKRGIKKFKKLKKKSVKKISKLFGKLEDADSRRERRKIKMKIRKEIQKFYRKKAKLIRKFCRRRHHGPRFVKFRHGGGGGHYLGGHGGHYWFCKGPKPVSH